MRQSSDDALVVDPLDYRHPSPPPLQRPKAVIAKARSQIVQDIRVTRGHSIETAAKELQRIRRHPSYSEEMREVHGEVPPIVKIEKEEPEMARKANVLLTPPKRPISVESNDDLLPKRQKAENGIRVEVRRPRTVISEDTEMIQRPLSREQMYVEVAKEHEEDARYIAAQGISALDDEDNTPPALVSSSTEIRPPRPRLKRAMSRSDRAVVDELTPGMRELMSPAPREASPDRKMWRTASPSLPPRDEIIGTTNAFPCHIRSLNGLSRSAFLPPGGNALGVKSPEYIEESLNRPLARLEHALSAHEVDVKPNMRRPLLSLPTSASEMPEIMRIHDEFNVSRPIEMREFYVHKRVVTIAKASEWSKSGRDGTIRLGRYFALSEEEIEEVKEYLRFIAGREAPRPKTMIRITCRPRNGQLAGQNDHAWPENTMVFLNGRSLPTTMVRSFGRSC